MGSVVVSETSSGVEIAVKQDNPLDWGTQWDEAGVTHVLSEAQIPHGEFRDGKLTLEGVALEDLGDDFSSRAWRAGDDLYNAYGPTS